MRVITHTVAGDECTIYVPEHEDDLAGFEIFLARDEPVFGADTETTGLGIYEPGFALRLAQFGDRREAWVLRTDRFAAAVARALRAPRRFAIANAPFDLLVADRCLGVPVEDLGPRVYDTRLLGHLLDPRSKAEGGVGHGLKDMSAAHVDPDAPDTSGDLTAVFRSLKLTKANGFAQIPIDHETYLRYAGLDAILARRLFDAIGPKVHAAGLDHLFQFEAHLSVLLTLLQRRGMLVDVDYARRLREDLTRQAEEFVLVAKRYGVENVNSTKQVSEALLAMGERLTERTKTGFKVDKEVLLGLADLDREWHRIEARDPNPLADAVIRSKRAGKWSGTYAQAFLDLRDEADRLHPFIGGLQARTARMCLPESERLMTRRGAVSVDEIREGDETLDASGSWVRVLSVHRYADAEVVSYRRAGGRYALRSTREHRWLQRSPRGREFLAPIASSRPTVVLAPQSDYDPLRPEGFIATTPGERFASLIGLLATDGRLASPTRKGEGMTALLYQTERKWYREILSLIPEGWVSYDRITNREDHHEIGLRIRSLRPKLEARGLVPEAGSTLKHHAGLWDWAANLPLNEAAAFARAVYLADGATSQSHRVVSAAPSVLRDSFRLACYRAGWLTTVGESKPSEWSNGPREHVSARPGVLHLRDRSEESIVEPVWCVTTESGTFTAEGAIGIYLTGNSVSRPPLQQLPSSDWAIRRAFIADPGQLIIASDYSQVEMRVLAAVCQDATLLEAILSGTDLHDFTAERVFGAGFTKAHRKIAKSIGFGKVYGGGATTIARQTGAPMVKVKEAIAAYDATFPGIRAYGRRLQRRAEFGRREVVTPSGRRLPLDRDRLYAATNYVVQSTARDLLAQAIVDLFAAGLGDHLLLPIHDEILAQAPAADADEVVHEIGRVMDGEFGGVPIVSDPEVYGRSWGSGYGCPPELDAA